MIKVGARTYSPRTSSVANALPGIRFSSAIGIEDSIFGIVALAVVLKIRPSPKPPSSTGCGLNSPASSCRAASIFDEFPVTPTGRSKFEIRDEINRRRAKVAEAKLDGTDASVSVAAKVRAVLHDALGEEFMSRCDPTDHRWNSTSTRWPWRR
jgi:hypothetical protein